LLSPPAFWCTSDSPEVEHRVQIRDFYNWLEAAGKSPAEMALKSRLRDALRSDDNLKLSGAGEFYSRRKKTKRRESPE
jgi:hypothetical protein